MHRAAMLVASTLVAAPLYAQDAASVDPRHYTEILKTDLVRVLRSSYPPGERSEMHEHPPNVTIILDDVRFRLEYPDGETSSPRLEAGRVGWGAGTIHEPRNIGEATARVMIVEFRNADVAEGIRQRPSPPESIQLGPGVTGEALIDNDLVAVRRVVMAPGAARETHVNDTRDLLVVPRDGLVVLTVDDQTLRLEPGDAHLIEHGTPHAESNPGGAPVEWIALLLEHR